jgi:hypothetical protein
MLTILATSIALPFLPPSPNTRSCIQLTHRGHPVQGRQRLAQKLQAAGTKLASTLTRHEPYTHEGASCSIPFGMGPACALGGRLMKMRGENVPPQARRSCAT